MNSEWFKFGVFSESESLNDFPFIRQIWHLTAIGSRYIHLCYYKPVNNRLRFPSRNGCQTPTLRVCLCNPCLPNTLPLQYMHQYVSSIWLIIIPYLKKVIDQRQRVNSWSNYKIYWTAFNSCSRYAIHRTRLRLFGIYVRTFEFAWKKTHQNALCRFTHHFIPHRITIYCVTCLH